MSETIDIMLSAEELEGTQATIAKWLFQEGELVNEGDPVVELETDKVSMEICAPTSGTLQQILLHSGAQVEVNSILGTLMKGQLNNISLTEDIENTDNSQNATKQQQAVDLTTTSEKTDPLLYDHHDENTKHLLSPAVRRLLKENNLDTNQITGTGKSGRVNRNDIMHYLARPSAGPSSTLIPHSNMRKTIARHMVESLLEVSPHVTSVFDMNMSNIIEHRKWHKKEYAEQGVNLTYTAYFLAAMVAAIRQAPECNARFHDDALEIFSDINIGVGTALGNKGLVVPVVQQVQTMSLFEIAKALTTQTAKARDGTLKPSDMKNGTITLSNHGVSGSLFAAPIIINQPQVAILGIGKLEKRVIVEENNQQDTIQIKPMCYVSLSIDHRALDAYQTSQFLSKFVEIIETCGE